MGGKTGAPPFHPLFLLIFLIIPAGLFARSYQIPQTIYVGDRAALLVPLPAELSFLPGTVRALYLNAGEKDGGASSAAPELLIHRLSLEHQELRIEFTAWAVGRLEMPPFDLLRDEDGSFIASAPGSGEFPLRGLYVTVESVLETGDALAGPAASLPAPGVYLLAGLGLTMPLLSALVLLWKKFEGKERFRALLENGKRRRLIGVMVRIAGKARKRLQKGGRGVYDEDAAMLAAEFRAFLSYMTGLECRAMAAGEFHAAGALGEELALLFGRWERLRYGGGPLRREDALGMAETILDMARKFEERT